VKNGGGESRCSSVAGRQSVISARCGIGRNRGKAGIDQAEAVTINTDLFAFLKRWDGELN
jgi:hypothetical protein